MNAHPHSRTGLYDEVERLHASIAALIKRFQEVAADRDEWKQQHENLLEVHRSDLAALAKRISAQSESALPIPGLPFADLKSAFEKPRRWADQYDFDKSDPATRLFVAASNWMDRAERAEEELQRVKVERGELSLKLAGAQCFIEEQRKKGNIG